MRQLCDVPRCDIVFHCPPSPKLFGLLPAETPPPPSPPPLKVPGRYHFPPLSPRPPGPLPKSATGLALLRSGVLRARRTGGRVGGRDGVALVRASLHPATPGTLPAL